MASILTNAETQMRTLIEGMTIVAGYNYIWGTAAQPDAALATGLYAVITPGNPFETNIDTPSGAHSFAYLNEVNYVIVVRPSLSTYPTLPAWEVQAYWNKAVDDLKKRFGAGAGSTLNGTVEHIQYRGHNRILEQAADAYKPGRIEARFTVVYSQDRESPETRA